MRGDLASAKTNVDTPEACAIPAYFGLAGPMRERPSTQANLRIAAKPSGARPWGRVCRQGRRCNGTESHLHGEYSLPTRVPRLDARIQ
jgi:hypothetical protein